MEMDQVNISGSGRRAEFHQKSLRSVTRPRYSQTARTWRQKSRYAVASIRLCSPTKHAIQPICCERCPARTAWQSGWLELLCKWQVMPRAAARSERDDRRATSAHVRKCRTDQLMRSAASSPWASASLRLNMSRCACIWKRPTAATCCAPHVRERTRSSSRPPI